VSSSSDLAELNNQATTAAFQHMTSVAWPTVLLTITLVLAYITNLALYATGQLPIWIAFPVIATLSYMAYTPVHEGVHSNICGPNKQLKWLNQLCGYVSAQVALIPFSSHRFEHLAHHRHTSDPVKDPDYVVKGVASNPLRAVLVMLKFHSVQTTYFAKYHWADANAGQKIAYCSELLLAYGWRIALLILIPEPGMFLVLVVGGTLGGVFTVYWFSYRPHHPFEVADRYRNTNSLVMPAWMKPVEWFWLGQNLHSIHHLFPRVPFYRYHRLHREIEPIMRAHGTPIVGIFSREPVEPAN